MWDLTGCKAVWNSSKNALLLNYCAPLGLAESVSATLGAYASTCSLSRALAWDCIRTSMHIGTLETWSRECADAAGY